MEAVISELVAQWGLFGLIVAMVGYTIYENHIKKGKDKTQGGCQKGEIIYDSLKDIKDSINVKLDGVHDSISAINTKVECLEDKFDTKIQNLEDQMDILPKRNLQEMHDSQQKQSEAHTKQMEDVLKLGPKLYNILEEYIPKINCTHIFIGSFHNGTSSMSGIPYCKFDLISERFNKKEIVPADHEFAPVYKDADLLRYGKLPMALVRQETLYFKVEENNNSDLFNYDDIIVRRMIGMGIKQIALRLLKDSNNKPSGFVGCVKYNYDPLNVDELVACGSELEHVYHKAEQRNKTI